MHPVKQTILHDPDDGKFGNCAQAAFASLFELPIEEVPHFADGLDNSIKDGTVFNTRVREWLNTMGYGTIVLNMVPENIEEWKPFIPYHHLIAGLSPRHPGTYHVVVGKGGEIVHDPHPDDTGLLPPTDDDPWYFEFIVKLL
jgi:hypothetical protein